VRHAALHPGNEGWLSVGAANHIHPVFGILLSPMVGAAAMALSSLSVIANALRLARTRLD
jgi:P-type Cu+ transporter